MAVIFPILAQALTQATTLTQPATKALASTAQDQRCTPFGVLAIDLMVQSMHRYRYHVSDSIFISSKSTSGLTKVSDYRGGGQTPASSSTTLSTNPSYEVQPRASPRSGHSRTPAQQPVNSRTSQAQPSNQLTTPSALPGPVFGVLKTNPANTGSSNTKSADCEARKLRRQRNTAAARKYRQRRLDRIEELEQALQQTQTERDELKVQVARWKGKAEALQALMAGSGTNGLPRHR